MKDAMFVLTADQVASRTHADLVEDALNDITSYITDPVLRAERTVGDEFQVLVAEPSTALDIILRLTRTGRWSVGCGVGAVRSPLPASIREASGPAFVAARAAVERAKKRPTRFALERET
ncbi:MAG: DNA-binding protein, partial [Terrimesophilobacter sp.]